MTGFSATVDQQIASTYDEAASAGNGKFPPLPKGNYQAKIVPLSPKNNELFKVEPFNTKNPAYNGKNVLRLRVQIDAESPTGKNRSFNVRIPLFSRYAPSEKSPQGAVAKMYFDFWEKVAGASKEQVISGNLPGWEVLANRAMTISISDPKVPDQWNELGSNEIAFVSAPTGNYAATPVRVPGVPVAPWLDANDNLIAAPQVAALQAPAGAPAWGVSATDAAAAVAAIPAGVGAPAWSPQQSAAAWGVPAQQPQVAPAWGQQAVLQNAAATGVL